MKTRDMTCIGCPMGCKLHVELDDEGKILSISGYTCKKGEQYATNEVTHPMRTLTTTVDLIDSKTGNATLPVRTSTEIPKESLFDAMALSRTVKAKAPIKTGDILIKDFIIEGCNLVSCKDAD